MFNGYRVSVVVGGECAQSSPTLCDPRDCSPLAPPWEEIFQARLLEKKVKVKLLSRIQLFAIPWTVAYEVPPSMEFSRQEY